MIKIIAHRGYWQQEEEKNQQVAFVRAFDHGYGVETDFRDVAGNLVISHDIPAGGEMSAERFFALLKGRRFPLAINIKSDGLAKMLQALLQKCGIDNYFVFDMSIPDALQYLRLAIPVFSRVSEYEPEPAFYDDIAGVWIDAFHDIWYSPARIQNYLQDSKSVCLVSPELHGRDPMKLWHLVKQAGLHHEDRLMLCTDFPEKASAFFT